MTTFLDATTPLAHCAGCGHPHVLRALDEALAQSGRPAERVALVSDIGCVGLADPYFPTLHTVHTLHGRSAAIATGIRLGERPHRDPPIRPVVLVGDGGATIGLLHLVHAAQLDVGLTVVVHNNLVYGMTGGQHSGLTPGSMRTTTTPEGNPAPPLDLAKILDGAGAGFYARVRAPGPDLVPALVEAITRPGFACVEALELCPTFAARLGGVTGRALDAMVGADPRGAGVLYRRPLRPAPSLPPSVDDDPFARAIEPVAVPGRLAGSARVVVAGRAGERVQSAARLVAAAAVAARLHVSVRTDNPVTQGRGFSLAEIVVSPHPVADPECWRADILCLTAPEGLAEARRRGLLSPESPPGRTVLDSSIEAPDLAAAARIDLRGTYGGRAAALGALAAEVAGAGWWGEEAWRQALSTVEEGAREEAVGTLARAGAVTGP